MSNLIELDKIDRLIKDSEIRLKSIELSVQKIDHEISVLIPLQNQLEQNLQYLKSSNAVPIAQEYKRAKQELTKTKTRIAMISSDRSKAQDAVREVIRAIAEMKRQYMKLINLSTNNVIQGKFGRHGS